jgi:hypothetical protein
MPGIRWAKVAVPALLAGVIVFGAVHLLGPFLARHFGFLAVPRPATQKIVASTELTSSKTTEWEKEETLPDGSVIASVPGQKIRQVRAWTVRATQIGISYETPIDVNSTAAIEVTVQQDETDHFRAPQLPSDSGKAGKGTSGLSFDGGSASEPHPVAQLEWPLLLRMKGLGLDWLAEDIKLDSGLPLPVTRHWSVKADKAQDYVMLFQVTDVNRAAGTKDFSVADTVNVSINGIAQPFK